MGVVEQQNIVQSFMIFLKLLIPLYLSTRSRTVVVKGFSLYSVTHFSPFTPLSLSQIEFQVECQLELLPQHAV